VYSLLLPAILTLMTVELFSEDSTDIQAAHWLL